MRFFRLSFLTAFLVDWCAGCLIFLKFSEVRLIVSVLSEELQGVWPVSFDLLSWIISTCIRELDHNFVLDVFFSKVFERLVLGWHPPINLFNAWYSTRAVGWVWMSMFYQSSEKRELCLTVIFYLVSFVRFLRLSFLTAFLVDWCAGFLIFLNFSERCWLVPLFLRSYREFDLWVLTFCREMSQLVFEKSKCFLLVFLDKSWWNWVHLVPIRLVGSMIS